MLIIGSELDIMKQSYYTWKYIELIFDKKISVLGALKVCAKTEISKNTRQNRDF